MRPATVVVFLAVLLAAATWAGGASPTAYAGTWVSSVSRLTDGSSGLVVKVKKEKKKHQGGEQGEHSCPPDYVVLKEPNKYGSYCQPKEGLPATPPAEEKCKGRAHILGLLKLHFLGAVGVGAVKVDVLAVGNEELPGRVGILPSHATRLPQIELTRLGAAASLDDIGFLKAHLKRLNAVVAVLYLFEEIRDIWIRSPQRRRGKHRPCDRESHTISDVGEMRDVHNDWRDALDLIVSR